MIYKTTFFYHFKRKSLFIPQKTIYEIMILSIRCAGYSYRHRLGLQPIVLIIGPITRMAVISVQLYLGF